MEDRKGQGLFILYYISVIVVTLHRFARARNSYSCKATDKSDTTVVSIFERRCWSSEAERERHLNVAKVSRDETRDEFPATAFSASLS